MSNKYKFYNPDGIYFVSFSVVNWIDVFTMAVYKSILLDSIQYCQGEKGLVVYAWVIMSRHVHMIVSKSSKCLLSDIFRDMKKFTAVEIIHAIKNNEDDKRRKWMLELFELHGINNSNNKHYQFWQQDNHPVELSTNEMIDQRLVYLHDNPVKAGIVYDAAKYLWSSARDYCGIKGLLDVVVIE